MDSELDKKLDTIFKNVNDWLKFAEQKNAALLVLNVGLIWGISRVLPKNTELEALNYWLNFTGYSCLILSSIVCIVSFMPVLNDCWFSQGDRKNSDNCLFFGDIAKYDATSYIKLVISKLPESELQECKFDLDYANQITNNAKITLTKYKWFGVSSKITILGSILLSVSLGILLG